MENQVIERSTLRSGVEIQPGQSAKFTVKSLVTLFEFDAVGGPPSSGLDDAGNSYGPTQAGEYVIVGLWKHVSTGQWGWSKIEWGTPMQEKNGRYEVLIEGVWKYVDEILPVSSQEIKSRIIALYEKDVSMWNKTWVFNDFGHITCFIARDLDKNGKFDRGKEKIHHQFFHTVPVDEVLTYRNREKDIELSTSHGCIHLKPKDIDTLVNKGFMKPGNIVYIYDYSLKPLNSNGANFSKPPYSLHFFPGLKKLFVKGHGK
jgi:glycerol-3-phosphate cytidylyltransferase-like family protein